jgi:hypothetical protein
MFIRGVGNLRPEPNTFGPYALCNYDVLDALLLCATRAAFDQLIKGLRESFDVTLLNEFEFEFQDEQVPTPAGTSHFTRSYVTGWRITSVSAPVENLPVAGKTGGEVVQFPGSAGDKPDGEH